MTSYEMLLCGGPGDGLWVTSQNGSYVMQEASPPMRVSNVLTVLPAQIDMPPHYEYDVQPMEMFGKLLYLGVNRYKEYRWERLAARTVLQRDVVQHLGFMR